jgi:adenylate cyclase
MATDERRTYERWMALLDEVVRPTLELHNGRIVDLAGDGVLAEFGAAPDALQWARLVQRRMRELHEARGAGSPHSIALRIGLHAGHVFVSENRIFGEAVNLAARLQEHARPGGIVLSEAMRGLVGGMPGEELRDLGPLELRNIGAPVRACAIDTDAVRIAQPLLRPAEHGLPSIAVLPLQNLGGDPADDYFGDGIVEDIVVSLAGLHELFVISRSSTLAFRGTQPDPRQVGRALGVRYVLTGSLRRSARALRVSVQLCDARTGGTLWADRMEIAPGDLFELQDEIVVKVVAGIAPTVRSAELRQMLRKRPESLTAYDHTLRALHALHHLDRDTSLEALRWLERAMAEDPGFAMPVAWAAWWYSLWIGQGWSSDIEADTGRAVALAAKAVALDEQNAIGLTMQGHLLAYLRREPEAAMSHFDRAIAASPNGALAWMYSSTTLSYLGRGEEAVQRAEYALRLSPQDQRRFLFHARLAIANYALGSYEEAARWASLARLENPTYTTTLKALAASLAALGRVKDARDAVKDHLALEPGFRLGDYARSRLPFRDPGLRARFVRHLRSAGVPD